MSVVRRLPDAIEYVHRLSLVKKVLTLLGSALFGILAGPALFISPALTVGALTVGLSVLVGISTRRPDSSSCWVPVVGIAAVVLIAATIVSAVHLSTEDNNANKCAVEGHSIECYKDLIPPASERNEAQLIEAAKNYADKPPAGSGPWPFVVVRDKHLGLKVRSTNTVEGAHIGGLAHLSTAWVTCEAHSGFDPEGNGDLWYKIKWDHQQPNATEYFESRPGASGTGWVHSYYLVPVKHNGKVPACDGS